MILAPGRRLRRLTFALMASPDRTLVTIRSAEMAREYARIDASTPALALSALDQVDDVATVCAVLGDDMDRDEFVALVSVLVVRGVAIFDTEHPQIVQRVLDTHTAISAGQIEVLES